MHTLYIKVLRIVYTAVMQSLEDAYDHVNILYSKLN